ncbi:Na+/H+ antiporter subunit E [Kaarinaea lacus]
MRIIIAAVLIFVFWFVLSGHTELWLLLLGLASTALTVFLSSRMSLIDHESHPFHLSARLLRYFLFLGWEIITANLGVVKRILTPGRTINPQVVQIPTKKKTDLGKVIYANSITLTPGTVTMELTEKEIKVHSLSDDSLKKLQSERIANKVPDNEAP